MTMMAIYPIQHAPDGEETHFTQDFKNIGGKRRTQHCSLEGVQEPW